MASTMLRSRLLVSTGLATMLLASSAQAQTTASPSVVEEVIVTAQKRAEDVQSVPAAVTAASGATLQAIGAADPQNLAKLTPGLAIGPAGGGITQIYIRGVGNYAANAYAEGAVAFHVDGVYISRPTAIGGVFYDLARVEVLKGPQGTLYGRNATGGAVNVVPNRPKLGETGGALNVEVGNYDLFKGEGALNLAVSEKVAARAAFQINQHDGYLSDGYDDDKSRAARLQVLVEPSDKLSILLSGDLFHKGGVGAGSVISPFVTSDPWLGPSTTTENNFLVSQPGAPLPNPYIKADGRTDLDSKGVSAEVNYDLGFANLLIQPAYRTVDNKSYGYGPGFLVDQNESSEQTSLEARLTSAPASRITWTLGAFYFDENQHSLQNYDQKINQTSQDLHLGTTAKAVFGQATAPLSESLRVTVGGRYSQEDKDQSGTTKSRSNFTGGPLGAFTPASAVDSRKSFSHTDWRVGVEYDLAEHALLYANVSTAFKAGGFFAAPPPDNQFAPEQLTAYAIGSKTRLLDGRLRLNAEAFWWDYKNHQESHLSPGLVSPAPIFRTENIGKMTVKGVDVDGDLKVGSGGAITFQYSYLDAVFDTFSYRSTGPLAACRSTPFTSAAPAGSGYVIDCSGMPAVRAPKHSGSLGYLQRFDVGDGARITGQIRTQFASKTYLAVDYLPGELQKSYHMTDADLTYDNTDGGWSLTAWVRNIENEAVKSNAFLHPFRSVVYANLRPPRTYGLRFNKTF